MGDGGAGWERVDERRARGKTPARLGLVVILLILKGFAGGFLTGFGRRLPDVIDNEACLRCVDALRVAFGGSIAGDEDGVCPAIIVARPIKTIVNRTANGSHNQRFLSLAFLSAERS